MKKVLLLCSFILLLCGCNSASSSLNKNVDNNVNNNHSISCDEMKEMLNENKNAILIDVREEDEYNEGHLKDAVNIPYERITQTLETYGTIDFDTSIVVYCASGVRSEKAYNSLKDVGYKNIYDLGSISNCD